MSAYKSVVSLEAGKSILSQSALFRLKCQFMQRQGQSPQPLQPLLPALPAPSATGKSKARGKHPLAHMSATDRPASPVNKRRLFDTPYKLGYTPLSWTDSAAASFVLFGGAAGAAAVSSSPRPHPATLPTSLTMNPFSSAMLAVSEAQSLSVDARPPDAVPLSLAPAFEVEPSSPSRSPLPDAPAGFLDLSDLPAQLPASPYPDAPALDACARSADAHDEFAELEKEDEEEYDPSNDPAVRVAKLLVRAHEAGYELDSLVVQIQMGLLR